MLGPLDSVKELQARLDECPNSDLWPRPGHHHHHESMQAPMHDSDGRHALVFASTPSEAGALVLAFTLSESGNLNVNLLEAL